MMTEPEYFTFDIEEKIQQTYEDVGQSIGPTQRRQLQKLAQEGEPLWLIMKGLLDLKAYLRASLANADLFSPGGMEMARKVQWEIRAIDYQRQIWERLLSIPAEKVPENDGPDDFGPEAES